MKTSAIAALLVLVLALALGIAGGALAFIRLETDDSTPVPIFWPNAHSGIRFTINSSGSADVPDLTDDTAVRLGAATWERVDTAGIDLVEEGGPKRDRRDFTATDVHLVMFDETNETGYFPANSTTIAITPLLFDLGSGAIMDADILFNGGSFTFSTERRAGTYDVQNIATHEFGHFLGLDHSGVYGATMVPFASPTEMRLRSLAADDRAGLATIYPRAGTQLGRITGRMVHANGTTPVVSGHVVAVEVGTGEPASACVSDRDGSFALSALPAPGSYFVYFEPLDGPTSDANLQRNGIDTAFGSLFHGGNEGAFGPGGTLQAQQVGVGAGGVQTLGDVVLPAAAGMNIDGYASGSSPLVVRGAGPTTIVLTGTGLAATSASVSGPGLTIANVSASPTMVSFLASAGPSARLGLYDVYLRRTVSGSVQFAALPGAIEIIEAAPSIVDISPPDGATAGGTQVTISGTGFRSGATVLFRDGIASPAAVDSATQITATAPPGTSGEAPVTVINPDGQQAQRRDGFRYVGVPRIDAITPAEGPTAGGVEVTFTGQDFAPGLTVRFGGASASGVQVVSSTEVRCTVPARAQPVSVDVTATNTDGGTFTRPGGYTYVLPAITSLSPDRGSTVGGTVVRVIGRGFAPQTQVDFGPQAAVSVFFVSVFEVEATAPAAPDGSVDIGVTTSDGKVATLAGGFQYLVGNEPRLTDVSPSSGPTGGRTVVTVRGSGFEPGATVAFDGTPATKVTVVSATEIRATTPAHAAGAVGVTVTNPNTLTNTLAGGFTYAARSGGGGGGGGGGCSVAAVAGDAAAASLLPFFAALLALAILGRRLRRPVAAASRARTRER